MHLSREEWQGDSLKHACTSKRFVNVEQLNPGLAADDHLGVKKMGDISSSSILLKKPRIDQRMIGVGTKESFAPPSEPNGRISRIKCGRPHLMRYVAFPLMWRWIRTPRPERAELRWSAT